MLRPHCIAADGNPRMIVVVNRRLPGPSIEVCKGDRIIVDVKNMMYSESTTIHWHGIHQRGTPFMDGVPMISQCPIPSGDSFRYDFKADSAGTYWWHSHNGFQRTDGVFCGLIVRQPATKNIVGHLYDRDEHLIILNEWNKHPGAENYLLLYHVKQEKAHTIMINGLARYGNDSLIPRHIFHVKQGTRHRFRLINAGNFECSTYITVDQHPLLVVSSDGADVEPVEVDAIRLMPGERYDFVSNANRPIDNYWLRIVANGTSCIPKKTYQEAILRYEGATDTEPNSPTGFNLGFESVKRLLNPAHQGSETPGTMCVPCLLTSLEPDDDKILATTPNYRYYLLFDQYGIDNREIYRKNLYDTRQVKSFSIQINHLSYVNSKFPLQTQSELVRPDQFCNVTEAKCTREQCFCTQFIQFKLNSTVELVLASGGSRRRDNLTNPMVPHPIHIHGLHFRVLAMERLGNWTTIEEVKAWDEAGNIRRKLKGAPWKDTVDLPSGGYTVIRFRADNPGYWFFHCHLETHSHNGMAMVLKIGEHQDFAPVPKDFPGCLYHSDGLQLQNAACTRAPVKLTFIIGILSITHKIYRNLLQ